MLKQKLLVLHKIDIFLMFRLVFKHRILVRKIYLQIQLTKNKIIYDITVLNYSGKPLIYTYKVNVENKKLKWEKQFKSQQVKTFLSQKYKNSQVLILTNLIVGYFQKYIKLFK